MKNRLRIRNWREFQQYKDRCPPWIKLHREILQSEDWVMWDDPSRVLAIVCMLLASRTEDGSLSSDPVYIQRAAYLNSTPDLRPLIDCGFLELNGDASELYETLAPRTTETEKRRDREETEKEETSLARGEPSGGRKRKKKVTKPDYTPEFETFWTLTWKRGHKAAAFETWIAMEASEHEEAVGVAASWTEAFEHREASKRPHVSTWLNNRGWEDDVGAETAKKKLKPGDRGYIPTGADYD